MDWFNSGGSRVNGLNNDTCNENLQLGLSQNVLWTWELETKHLTIGQEKQ